VCFKNEWQEICKKKKTSANKALAIETTMSTDDSRSRNKNTEFESTSEQTDDIPNNRRSKIAPRFNRGEID